MKIRNLSKQFIVWALLLLIFGLNSPKNFNIANAEGNYWGSSGGSTPAGGAEFKIKNSEFVKVETFEANPNTGVADEITEARLRIGLEWKSITGFDEWKNIEHSYSADQIFYKVFATLYSINESGEASTLKTNTEIGVINEPENHELIATNFDLLLESRYGHDLDSWILEGNYQVDLFLHAYNRNGIWAAFEIQPTETYPKVSSGVLTPVDVETQITAPSLSLQQLTQENSSDTLPKIEVTFLASDAFKTYQLEYRWAQDKDGKSKSNELNNADWHELSPLNQSSGKYSYIFEFDENDIGSIYEFRLYGFDKNNHKSLPSRAAIKTAQNIDDVKVWKTDSGFFQSLNTEKIEAVDEENCDCPFSINIFETAICNINCAIAKAIMWVIQTSIQYILMPAIISS